MIKKILRKAVPRGIIIQRLNSNADHHLLLTFDDGPHEKLTPKVLSLLKKFHARAIFFYSRKIC